jgi:NTP pyrophosphatase (non-canonical NTP hydrolase)
MEVGFASGLGIPVFSSTRPSDVVLASLVRVVPSVADALSAVTAARLEEVGRPLRVLQAYYDAVASRRGYTDETPQDVMLLITEEIGELARAVRRAVGLIRDTGFTDENAAEELADVQLYLVHLANALQVDLASAVSAKETVNSRRHLGREGSIERKATDEHPSDPVETRGVEAEEPILA